LSNDHGRPHSCWSAPIELIELHLYVVRRRGLIEEVEKRTVEPQSGRRDPDGGAGTHDRERDEAARMYQPGSRDARTTQNVVPVMSVSAAARCGEACGE
jgi:hypothetical protein